MSSIASIDVRFSKEYPFIDIVAVLEVHGWQFFGGNIVYLPPLEARESEDDWNWKVSSLDQWQLIQQEIKSKQLLKETVGVKLEWIETECIVEITLNTNYCLQYLLLGNYPQLPNSKMPNFSWLLSHTVLPLEKWYSIREVECSLLHS